MRLIDADALKQEIFNYFDGVTVNNVNGAYIIRDTNVIIDNAPTAPLPDFKEGYKQAIIDGKTNFSRPTGEWKETRYETAIGITYRQTQCSNCGWKYELPMWFNFCPTCGADMRGKENEVD